MASLDEKLMKLLENWRVDYSVDEAPEALKEVFREAGWEQVNPYDPVKHSPVVMTGQEWYDWFEKEFDKPVHSEHLMCARIVCADHALGAAKKASGIE